MKFHYSFFHHLVQPIELPITNNSDYTGDMILFIAALVDIHNKFVGIFRIIHHIKIINKTCSYIPLLVYLEMHCKYHSPKT